MASSDTVTACDITEPYNLQLRSGRMRKKYLAKTFGSATLQIFLNRTSTSYCRNLDLRWNEAHLFNVSSILWNGYCQIFAGEKKSRSTAFRFTVLHLAWAREIPRADIRLRTNQEGRGHLSQSHWPLYGGTCILNLGHTVNWLAKAKWQNTTGSEWPILPIHNIYTRFARFHSKSWTSIPLNFKFWKPNVSKLNTITCFSKKLIE